MNTATNTLLSNAGFGAFIRRFGFGRLNLPVQPALPPTTPSATPETEAGDDVLTSPSATVPPPAEAPAPAPAPRVPAMPGGNGGGKLSSRRGPRKDFEPGDLTELVALFGLLRIQNKTTLVIDEILRKLLSSPSGTEGYARELVRRLTQGDAIDDKPSERKVDTVVGFGAIGTLFATAIARALEAAYADSGHEVAVLPVEKQADGTYELSYAVAKPFVGGSRYIILAIPVITSESWQLIVALDALVKHHQTAPAGISRVVTVLQLETPEKPGEPDRTKRIPATRLTRMSFE